MIESYQTHWAEEAKHKRIHMLWLWLLLQKVQKQARPVYGVRSQNCIQWVGFCRAIFSHCFHTGLLCTFQLVLLGPLGFCNSDLSYARGGGDVTDWREMRRILRGPAMCISFFLYLSTDHSSSVYQSVHLGVHFSKWMLNQGIHVQKRDER